MISTLIVDSVIDLLYNTAASPFNRSHGRTATPPTVMEVAFHLHERDITDWLYQILCGGGYCVFVTKPAQANQR